MDGPYYRRRRYQNYGYPYAVPVSYPVTVVSGETSESACGCKAGSQIEQKIKENPVLFVAGALLVGYLLAKKR